VFKTDTLDVSTKPEPTDAGSSSSEELSAEKASEAKNVSTSSTGISPLDTSNDSKDSSIASTVDTLINLEKRVAAIEVASRRTSEQYGQREAISRFQTVKHHPFCEFQQIIFRHVAPYSIVIFEFI
jgi:hypothetical protein